MARPAKFQNNITPVPHSQGTALRHIKLNTRTSSPSDAGCGKLAVLLWRISMEHCMAATSSFQDSCQLFAHSEPLNTPKSNPRLLLAVRHMIQLDLGGPAGRSGSANRAAVHDAAPRVKDYQILGRSTRVEEIMSGSCYVYISKIMFEPRVVVKIMVRHLGT